MATSISPQELKSWLRDGRELALFDAREYGLYGESHLLFAVPLPYSRLEARLAALAPRRSVRLVFVDGGEADGPAVNAATRAEALGYDAVHLLACRARPLESWSSTITKRPPSAPLSSRSAKTVATRW
jgi:hypothetical protein